MSERATALERVLERMALKKVEQYRIDDYPQLADAVWGFWCDTVREVLRGQPTALPPGDAPQTCEWREDRHGYAGPGCHGGIRSFSRIERERWTVCPYCAGRLITEVTR